MKQGNSDPRPFSPMRTPGHLWERCHTQHLGLICLSMAFHCSCLQPFQLLLPTHADTSDRSRHFDSGTFLNRRHSEKHTTRNSLRGLRDALSSTYCIYFIYIVTTLDELLSQNSAAWLWNDSSNLLCAACCVEHSWVRVHHAQCFDRAVCSSVAELLLETWMSSRGESSAVDWTMGIIWEV